MPIYGPRSPLAAPPVFERPRAPAAPTTDGPTLPGPGGRVGNTNERSTFAEALEGLVTEADGAIRTAEAKAADFAEGRSNDIHGTMIAMQEADVRMRLLGNVRNRAIEAYREIMKMTA